MASANANYAAYEVDRLKTRVNTLERQQREMFEAMADTFSDGFWVGSPMAKWAIKFKEQKS